MKASIISTTFVCFSFGISGALAAESDEPVGQLSVASSSATSLSQWFKVGETPKLTWTVDFPEIVEITETGTINALKDTCFEVRVLGVAFQDGSGNHKDVELQVGLNRSFTQVFRDTGPNVRPSEVVASGQISEGESIDIIAQSYLSWRGDGQRSSVTANQNVIALQNGDPVPSFSPALSQGRLEDYASSYIQNGVVSIGPKDVIYFVETYSTSPGSYYFDMQDIVVLVSFDTCEESAYTSVSSNTNSSGSTAGNSSGNGQSNNGHGNNADGVDVSNPGQGHGGPNGEQDTDVNGDGTLDSADDDEVRGGSGNSNGRGNGR